MREGPHRYRTLGRGKRMATLRHPSRPLFSPPLACVWEVRVSGCGEELSEGEACGWEPAGPAWRVRISEAEGSLR